MVRPPTYFRFLYPGAVWNKPTNEKILYLTFDDGPTPEVTSSVLDLLSSHQAKATFFCIGENVEKHPALYNRIKAEGHSIGNHTHTHPNSWKVNSDFYLNDVEEARKVINSNLFRPPYGKLTPRTIFSLRNKYQIIMWDVISGVESLAKKGFIDTSKMGCMGWSQGGYISAFLTTNSNIFK